MKTACITGATGCVGRNLVDELLDNHWDVIVLHRKSSDLSRLKGCAVRFQEADLYDLESVRDAIPLNVDAVFHVAGNTSHWSAEAGQQWRDNVLTTRNLIHVALEKKVKRFIFTSTGATQGYQHLDERQVMRIRNGYVRSKSLAELEISKGIEQGLFAVILQPIIVIGRYDYNSYAQIFSNMKSSWVRLSFPGKSVFCHARDVAHAHLMAFEKGRNGESYVLGGACTTWLEAFQLICKCVGARPAVEAPAWLLRFASYFMLLASVFTKKKPLLTPELIGLLSDFADVSYLEKRKARQELGYESRPLDVMIKDCHQWLLQTGHI
jgi:dihydroflavonol-4-reductase